jgi:tetratricopeptide (TPR) repeat protein
MIFHRRRSQQWLLALAVLAPLPGIGATEPPRAVVTESCDIAPVWAGHPVAFALLTRAPFQFAAYYDAERRLTVAQRRIGEPAWKFDPLPVTTGWDSHNSIELAVDDDGFLHLSGDMHAVPLKYFRSSKPLDASSFQRIESMVGPDEKMCTYPRFFRGPNNDLLFTYRSGGSGDGNQIINVYDLETRAWRRLLDKPLTDGEGRRNAYFDGPVKGPDGWFHLAWVWRETPDCATNHDLCYARSKDMIHWQSAGGKDLSLPVTLQNSPIVDPVPERGGIINCNIRIGFDKQGRVTISYHKNDAAGNTQPWNARCEEGKWQFYQTCDWPYHWNFGGGGSLGAEVRLGGVRLGNDGQLTQAFRHPEFGHGIWRIDPQTLHERGTVDDVRTPAGLDKSTGTFPGLAVRWADDAGDSGSSNIRHVLRWETLGANRDAPRSGPLPPASMLRLYRIDDSATATVPQATTITSGFRTLPIVPLGPPNPWPQFRFQMPHAPLAPSADLSAEDRAGMLSNTAVPTLPYLVQDNYTRQRQPGNLPTIQIENAALRAVFYPSLGGRMMSLYDKRRQREMLFNNPILQFANLAIRNAWFSGGVEWNGPLFGHSLLTCSPVFAGVVDTPRGPLLRLYEFDRVLETAWQVDVFLPGAEDRLWVHIKAINPNARDIDFYWWSNIAVPLTRKTRVLSPADYALSHEATGNGRVSFPSFDGFDGSYPANYPYAKSIFFRKPGNQRPWSVCLDGQGRGLSHVSTAELSGRKFFTWGNSRGGQRWMDFLSEDGRGDYLEVQGGVTPTQLQTRPLKAGTSLEWTECFSPFVMKPELAQDPDYAEACAAAGRVIDAQVPESALREIHGFLATQADAPIQSLLHAGTGWGRLNEKRSGRKISPGLRFERVAGDAEQPWEELLTDGAFSAETLASAPGSFNVSDGWTTVLRESARTHRPTWLHHLHLGVALMEQGSFKEARENLTASIKLKENAQALRCLALLDERDGQTDHAQATYERAWPLCGNDPNLAVEICGFFIRHHRHAALAGFVKSLPEQVAQHERIVLMNARIALAEGNFESMRKLLDREFATIREGEVSLSELWFASHLKEAEQRLGRKPSPAERLELMKKFPPPRQIDFRMK